MFKPKEVQQLEQLAKQLPLLGNLLKESQISIANL